MMHHQKYKYKIIFLVTCVTQLRPRAESPCSVHITAGEDNCMTGTITSPVAGSNNRRFKFT